MKFIQSSLVLSLATFCATLSQVSAKPGSLDLVFNRTGLVTRPLGSNLNPSAVTLTPNGKILVISNRTSAISESISLTRFNQDGGIDRTFSDDGALVTSGQNFTPVTILPDAKMLFAGQGGFDSNLIFLARYHENGSSDTGFGPNGRVHHQIGSTSDISFPCGQHVLADGKILIAGTNYHPYEGEQLFLLRLNKNGSLDTGFSDKGIARTSFGGAQIGKTIAVQTNGQILVGGYKVRDYIFKDFFLTRFNPDGTIDSAFGDSGEVLTSLPGSSSISGIVIQPDGKIVACGTASGESSNFALVRYNKDGSPDKSFATNGIQIHNLGAPSSTSAIALQKDGKILVTGTRMLPGDEDFALVRYSNNGQPDGTFGSKGRVFTSFADPNLSKKTNDHAHAMALQADGRAIVVGGSDDNLAMARYNTLVRADASIGSKSSALRGDNVYNTTGAGQGVITKIKKSGGKKTTYLLIENDGHEKSRFTVSGDSGNSAFQVKYLYGQSDVTSAIKAGTFKTLHLIPGGSALLKVEITAKTKTANQSRDLSISTSAESDTTSRDTVKIRAVSSN